MNYPAASYGVSKVKEPLDRSKLRGIEPRVIKNYKNIKVKVSDGTIITGKINIMSFARLSEYLKQSNDGFITVLVEESDGSVKRTTIVNKEYIIWADTWD
jgi:hypothetical protein